MAFVPHDTEAIYAVLAGHGVEVPNATGVFGGLPGSCNRQRMVAQSDVKERFALGELPIEIDALEGKHIELGPKPGRLMFGATDAFEYTWQGGGGYGDPLDRPAAQIGRASCRERV